MNFKTLQNALPENSLFPLSAFIGFVTSSFNQLGGLMVVLLLSMVGDYITGIVKSSINGTISSSVSFLGIIKKTSMLLIFGIGMGVDYLSVFLSQSMNFNIVLSPLFGCITCIWLILGEWISILENLSECGVKMPPFLISILQKLSENENFTKQ